MTVLVSRLVEELTIMQRSLPSWVVFWLFVTGVVCTIDSLFIILRPHTLPDGKWNYLVKPCKSNEQSQDFVPSFSHKQFNMNRVETCLHYKCMGLYGNLTCSLPA